MRTISKGRSNPLMTKADFLIYSLQLYFPSDFELKASDLNFIWFL